MKKRIAIFASGRGSNMEKILECIQRKELKCACGLVFSDVPGAGCLEKARRFDVPVVSFSPKAFSDKAAFEHRLAEVVESHEIDYIVMAGYMRILSPRFIRRFRWRILNIHPSLLPAFRGAHGIRDAYEAKVEKTGVTVHFATEDVDGGPMILQEEVPIVPGETMEQLEEKVHAVEHRIYPKALQWVLQGRVTIEDDRVKFVESFEKTEEHS